MLAAGANGRLSAPGCKKAGKDGFANAWSGPEMFVKAPRPLQVSQNVIAASSKPSTLRPGLVISAEGYTVPTRAALFINCEQLSETVRRLAYPAIGALGCWLRAINVTPQD